MTKEERARQIDRQEFAAESAAALQRALAASAARRAQDRAKFERFLGRSTNPTQGARVPRRAAHRTKQPEQSYTYGGETLKRSEWMSRLNITLPCWYARVKRYGSPEAAIALGPNKVNNWTKG